MADHLITGTMTYVIVHCGNGRCEHVWEQAHTPLDDPGWHVCPKCLWSAPTNVSRAFREQPREAWQSGTDADVGNINFPPGQDDADASRDSEETK